MRASNWSRDELIVAFNLYCKIPFGRIHIRNPQIIELARAIGRSPSSVSWKLANFARLDPSLKKRNIAGASHGSKSEEGIWDEFKDDWDNLAYVSERLLAKFLDHPIEYENQPIPVEQELPIGRERESLVRIRVNQAFFRQAVLTSYGNRCCITGISIPGLLNASHIVPWSIDTKNRTNPRNGLCLNALHDRAFDRGLITIMPDNKVRISESVRNLAKSGDGEIGFLLNCEGREITLPERFAPDPDFLRYHNAVVFK